MKKSIAIMALLLLFTTNCFATDVFISQDEQFELHFLYPFPIVSLCWDDDYIAGYYWIKDRVITINLVGQALQFQMVGGSLRYGNYYFFFERSY